MTEIGSQFEGGDTPIVVSMIDAARRAGALRALARLEPDMGVGLHKAADYWSGCAATQADAIAMDAGLMLMRLADEAAEGLKAPASIPGQEGQ